MLSIRRLDIGTPHIYSLRFEEKGLQYYVLVEILQDQVTTLIRQVIILDSETLTLIDVTTDTDELKIVKNRIKGFTTGKHVITWHDVIADKIFDSIILWGDKDDEENTY